MRFLLSLILLLIISPAAFAGVKKNLSAVIPRHSLTDSEYKSLESFATELGKEIKNNWFPADYPNQNLRTVMKIEFMPDGKHHFEHRERSNNQSFDDTCYMAISRSLENYSYPHLTSIEYLFEYSNHKTKVPRELGRWPAQFGIGYLSKKFGINHFVTIPIY